MSSSPKHPRADAYIPSAPFWDGLQAGTLHLQQCLDSGQFQHYPRPVSLRTGSRHLGWRPVSGIGTIYSWTRVHVPVRSLPDAPLPVTLVTVDLSEGVRLYGRLLCDPDDVIAIGLPVVVALDPQPDGTPYPAFRLAGNSPTPPAGT